MNPVRLGVIGCGVIGRRHVEAAPSQDFAGAIREGRPPGTGLEQALVVQQITDAIYASAERGAAVEIA